MGSTPHLMLFQAGTVIPTASRMHGRLSARLLQL